MASVVSTTKKYEYCLICLVVSSSVKLRGKGFTKKQKFTIYQMHQSLRRERESLAMLEKPAEIWCAVQEISIFFSFLFYYFGVRCRPCKGARTKYVQF